MNFMELELLPVVARVMTYIGTVAVAGGVLFTLTMGRAHDARAVRTQVMFGALLLLIAEPLRYVLFQLSIAQGDVALAFDPAMRWLGSETPLGQAAFVRLLGLGIVLLGNVVSTSIATIGAVVIVGSFLIEGHTASAENRYFLLPLLFLHLLTVHWWLGALWPLRVAIGRECMSDQKIAAAVHRFAQQAVLAVGILATSGALMLASLIGWQPDASRTYQQGFLIKLGVFLVILLIAAINKLVLTPRLIAQPEAGRAGFRHLISLEMFVAFAILATTAVATSFPPTDH